MIKIEDGGEMKEEFKKWLKQAKLDLHKADVLFKSGDFDGVAFYSHQTAEKALKAMLIKKTKSLIKIHDLIILGRKVDLPKDLLYKCEKLLRIDTESRYEGIAGTMPYEKFNEVNSLDYFNIAREVLLWVEKNI
ncbi:MAG: HEPN domain-containing protein [archaeon]